MKYFNENFVFEGQYVVVVPEATIIFWLLMVRGTGEPYQTFFKKSLKGKVVSAGTIK